MRQWAEVFSLNGTYIGLVTAIASVSKTTSLDGAGSISVSYPAGDETATTLIQKERRVDLYTEEDSVTRLVGRGVVRDITASAADKTTFTATGPDTLDGLTRKNVLLGRSYTAESVYNIATDLLALVGGWFATVDDGVGSQTARFDGVNVLKALIRVATELGLHLREGQDINEIEIGAFGESSGITALAPGAITNEVMMNHDIVTITNLKVKSSSRDVVNWIIPLGAGEGTAALTLRDSTRTVGDGYPYAIQSTTGPDGRTLYYLSDSGSADTYGEIQKIVTFKEIGPVANSDSAKILAANALYDAAAAWLQRNALALDSYNVTVNKVRHTFRPGEKLWIKYKDLVETSTGYFTPVDVDDEFWILKATETISDSGMSTALEVATVDRHEQDIAQIVVGALEAISVKNVAIQTFPFIFQDSSERMIQAGAAPHYKEAVFGLKISDIYTDIIKVSLRVTSRPLISPTGIGINFGGSDYWYYYGVYESTWYPQGVHLYIDGVDVSTALGGPWNPNPGNSAIDVELDITSYITGASGGLYQDHSIVFKAEESNSQNGEVIPGGTSVPEDMSSGFIDCKILVLGSAQAIRA